MSAAANRAGSPITATVATVGVPGTSAQEYTFPAYVRPLVVTNMDIAVGGKNCYVLVNETGAATTKFLAEIKPGQAVWFGGIVNITKVSVFIPASGDYTKVRVIGWEA